MAIRKIVHGRESSASPFPGADGLLYVVFYGIGPVPDYDIAGWEQDKPIGGYAVIKEKISSDFLHYVDALSNLESELSRKTVNRKRGAVYIVENDVTKNWSLWLEPWENYFSRAHILKSPDHVERQLDEIRTRAEADLERRKNEIAAEQTAHLAKPSTWILLGLVGLIVIWQIVRWIA